MGVKFWPNIKIAMAGIDREASQSRRELEDETPIRKGVQRETYSKEFI